jgi:FkbM family methyltransferase
MTLRDLVEGTLGRFGFEVRRAGFWPRPSIQQVLENARAVGLEAASVIDVGVAQGTPGLYDVWPHAQLLLIDPIAEHEGVMRDITSGRGTYHVAAAGAQAGKAEMYVHSVFAISSLVGDPDEPLGRTTPTRTVDVMTIDGAAEELPGPIVMKLDVQGAEIEALRGATATLGRNELAVLEVSTIDLVPGQPVMHEVVCFMADCGFAVYDIFGGHLRPLDGALAALDLAFVPIDSALRSDRRYFASGDQADEQYRAWGG